MSDASRMPRVTKTSRVTRWRAFRSSVWNSSCGRSCRRGPMRRKTSAGPRIRSESPCLCVTARRPSSSAATMRAAVARPTPGMCSSSETSSAARRWRDPATSREMACAMSSADLPDVPLPTRIASSSDTVRPRDPRDRRRSRGRSESQRAAAARASAGEEVTEHGRATQRAPG